jgi:hypothetical protein
MNVMVNAFTQMGRRAQGELIGGRKMFQPKGGVIP